jgi:hypothetical protein
MHYIASQPVGIGKVLDTSIKLFVAGFSKLSGFMGILAVFHILMGLLTLQLQQTPNADPDADQAELVAQLFSNLPLLGIIILVSILMFALYGGIIYRLDNLVHGQPDSFVEALQFGFTKLPSSFFAMVLYVIAIMVGSLLLLIPGLILMESLALYLYFIVIENKGAIAALRASHGLVWGNWWNTMAVFTPPMIIWLAVMLTVGIVIGLLGMAANQVLIQVVTNLLSVFVTPYFFTLGFVQYHNLKLRKSGSDLEQRLA